MSLEFFHLVVEEPRHGVPGVLQHGVQGPRNSILGVLELATGRWRQGVPGDLSGED